MRKLLHKLMILTLAFGFVSSSAFGQITDPPPTIDGDGSDAVWATVAAMDLLREYDYEGVTDAADLSGTVKTLWDASNIYVLLEVMDDSLYVDAATNPWERDHYTVYFDLSNLKTTSYVADADATLDSVQFNVEKPWSEPQGWDWEGDTLEPGVDFVEVIRDDGYTLEFAFPLHRLGVALAAESVIGYDVKIGDNDGDGRDGMFSLYQIADEGWQNPSYLGSAKLEADGSVSKVMHSPVIDGVADYPWYAAEDYDLKVEHGYTGVTDAADLSGTFKVMHDNDNVFVFLDVQDDSLYVDAATNPWERDHYTIYFDVSNLKTESYVADADATLDSIQFNVEKPWSEPQGWSWEGDTLEPGVDFVEVIGDDGYTVEFAFPLHRLGVSIDDEAIIGFDVKIGDNDGDGRDGMYSWHQRLDESWQNPSYMGNLKLEPVFVDLGTTSAAAAQIEIDGIRDGDWNQALPMPLEREYDYTGVTDAADLSGTAYALWDPDNFYVLLEVNDDSLYVDAATNPWERDHYTIYFDLDNLKTETYVESTVDPLDSIQFNVEKPWSEPQGFNWEGDTLIQGVDFVEVIGEDGYTLEFAFPLHKLGVTLEVTGNPIGWDVKIGDNDGDGRDGMYSWNQLADEGWQNPSYLGEVTLLANGTVFGTPEIAPEDVTFNVDMNGMIDAEIFDPAVDNVDIAGSFNNWGDPVQGATDDDADGIYTVVVSDQEVGADLEYKFRVNGTWDPISEFPGGGPNRTYTVVEGDNVVTVTFNDGDYTPWLDDAIEMNFASRIRIYPNPASSTLNIINAEEINTIELVNLIGQVTLRQINSGSSAMVLPLQDQKACFYVIRFTSFENETSYRKLIIE